MFFGYTHCPDICQIVMADIASALARLDPSRARQVEMLFVTTDPARDDPATLRAYLDRFDPAFEGLTGDAGRRSSTSASAVGVPIEKGAEAALRRLRGRHGTRSSAIDARRRGRRSCGPRARSAAQLAEDIAQMLDRRRPRGRRRGDSDVVILASIPSPDQGVWYLGPFPIRAYALCIIAGVVVAVWLGERRWVARGGKPGQVGDIAIWAVPFGLVGGRLYHVITDTSSTSARAATRSPRCTSGRAASASGARSRSARVGAWIGCRRAGVKFLPLADALAPGIAIAQAIGRWGNWFNQELFGRPTDAAVGAGDRPGEPPSRLRAVRDLPPDVPLRVLWNLGVAALVIWADRRFRLGYGRVFALYVMGYTRRPRLDRVPPHRRGAGRRRLRPAAERVDLDRGVPGRRSATSWSRPAPPGRERARGSREPETERADRVPSTRGRADGRRRATRRERRRPRTAVP